MKIKPDGIAIKMKKKTLFNKMYRTMVKFVKEEDERLLKKALLFEEDFDDK
jgi:hypothetical protein